MLRKIRTVSVPFTAMYKQKRLSGGYEVKLFGTVIGENFHSFT
jgi:hypothetical protein